MSRNRSLFVLFALVLCLCLLASCTGIVDTKGEGTTESSAATSADGKDVGKETKPIESGDGIATKSVESSYETAAVTTLETTEFVTVRGYGWVFQKTEDGQGYSVISVIRRLPIASVLRNLIYRRLNNGEKTKNTVKAVCSRGVNR